MKQKIQVEEILNSIKTNEKQLKQAKELMILSYYDIHHGYYEQKIDTV
jgi:hypothetical protein